MNKIMLKKGEYEYSESDRLGKGSFGEVYRGRVVQTGEVVAIKIISMKTLAKYGEEIKKVVSSEISVMVKLSKKMMEKHCPFIVRILDCFRTENSIYIILEYCGEGDLEKHLNDKGSLKEAEAMHIIYDVCRSLEFLYENGITHRDLKPQNIFMKKEIVNGESQMIFKLGDFGFAAQKNTFSTTLGTYPYMAPELFESGEYDSGVDVWALGVMTHQLAFGHIYFIGNDQWEIKKKVLNVDYKLGPKERSMVSSEFQDFVSKCLVKDRSKRMKASDLCSHPVFNKIREQQLTSIPAAVKNAQNTYFVRTIKQLSYKSFFLVEVSRSLIETGRKTLYAGAYLAKKALCYSSLLESKLNMQQPPFDCDPIAWTVFTTGKDYKDAAQFVSNVVKNRILGFFTAVYNQFRIQIGKFPPQDQQNWLRVVSNNPLQDINSQIYENEIIKWRKELDSDMKILAYECLLASKIDLITTYNFEQHVSQRKTLTEEILRKRISEI